MWKKGKRIASKEQYSRRECVELVGLEDDLQGEELEKTVIQAGGVEVKKRIFMLSIG